MSSAGKESMDSRPLITIAFVVLILSCFGASGCFASEIGPFSIEVSTPRIAFHISGPPGIYASETPITVSILSGFAEWTLYCQATPLVETNGKGFIPPERLYLAGGMEELSETEEGMIPLSEHPVIAMGSFTGPEPLVTYPLTFRVKTLWEDQPGTYVGSIVFTFLAMP